VTHHDVDGCVDLRVAALQEELERLGELVRLAVEVARLGELRFRLVEVRNRAVLLRGACPSQQPKLIIPRIHMGMDILESIMSPVITETTKR